MSEVRISCGHPFFRNEACDGEVFEALCVEVDEGNEAIEGFEVS